MLTPDEIEAAVARRAMGGSTHGPIAVLSRAALDLIAKIPTPSPNAAGRFVTGAGQPRPAKLAARARPHRHDRPDPSANHEGKKITPLRYRDETRPRQRERTNLADRDRYHERCGFWRMVRTAKGLSQFRTDRGDRRRLSRRSLSERRRRAAGENGARS